MKQISKQKEPLVASISFSQKKGGYDYGTLKLSQDVAKSSSISTTVKTPIVLCTFSIPLYISIPEFLDFVAPVDSSVNHYRVLRETTPDTYMILMEFRDISTANTYYNQYNGRLYSSMEPEKCQIIYVESLEIDSKSASFCQLSYPDLEDDALSICPVCLEPMDDKITGLLTILCQHAFHSRCLSKWEDGSCPVCRYSQKPQQSKTSETDSVDLIRIHQMLPSHTEQNDQNECTVCKASDNLWVCLICGHIGCGRYNGAHAYDHYRQTSHLYSLEISTQRVWDYAGDNYVHRLVQNAVDGKLVELPSRTTSPNEQSANYTEKIEAMSIEYSYMLTSQLDSQRIYFENQMEALTAQLSQLTSQTRCLITEYDNTKVENKQIADMNDKKKKRIDEIAQEKKESEHKLDMWKEKYDAIRKIWTVEKESTNTLLENNDLLVKNIAERDRAISDLNEQVRDLMFFLETRERVQGNPELEGASVGTRTTHSRTGRRRGKR